MNRNHHRIVFNAARGQLMAVSETASPGTQSTAGRKAPASTARPKRWQRPGIALLLAFSALSLPAQSQITADPSAAGNLRPTVLTAPNGVPLINIQTPSAAGVSRNVYRQFDVSAQGAILNNSRTDVQTQLGGWVGANPWLAAGPARVILNEVNASQATQLSGWVEVGGQRAEVVIATGAQPIYRLSLAQTQEGLDPVYLSYAKRASLAPEELLHAATGALGILAAKSRPVLGLSLARYISHYCMLEAAKTAGRRPQKTDFSEVHLRPLASLLPPRSLLQRLSGWFDDSTIRNYLHAGHK